MTSFGYLTEFGKTPADLGLRWEEVDPAWRSAMLVIHNGLESERRMMAD